MLPSLLKDTRLLIMCSSRQRPDRLRDTISSFNLTRSPGTLLIIYVSLDDPKIKDYVSLFNEFKQKNIIGPYRNMIQVLNYMYLSYPDVQYYGDVNDDHIYRTKNWDLKLIRAIDKKNGWSIAYGVTQNLPSPIMMSGKLVRTLGYYLPPCFQHSHVDNYIMDIGKALNLLTYVPEVLILHMHIVFGKANIDLNYKWVMSNLVYVKGVLALKYWEDNCRNDDINKIIQVMKKERNNVSNR